MSRKPRGRGRPAYEPTQQDRALVEKMAAVGIPHEQIASVLGISSDTLVKNYGELLKVAATQANAKMAGALFKNGINGNVAAQIFWMKTRAQWKEQIAPIDVALKPSYVLRRGPTRKSQVSDEPESSDQNEE